MNHGVSAVRLGKADAELSIHLCRSRGASSFYEPNHAWLDGLPNSNRYGAIATKSVPVLALESLQCDSRVQYLFPIDVMKIDAQWAELAMLKESTQTLTRQTIGAEVEFVKFDDQQPLFCDTVMLFKLRRKLSVRKNCQTRPQLSTGQLIAVDTLSLHDPVNQSTRPTPQWSAHQLRALVLIASLYDLMGVSLELLVHLAFSSVLVIEPLQRFIRERSRRLNF